VRENSVVPPGLELFLPLFPALKRWAKFGRPSGAAILPCLVPPNCPRTSSHTRFLGVASWPLLHDRTNRGRGQNLKGRSWRPCRLRQRMVGNPKPQSDVYQRTLRYPPKDYYAGSWSCGRRFWVRAPQSAHRWLGLGEPVEPRPANGPFEPWICQRNDETLTFFVLTAQA
jgi:hypothetical protein